MVDKHGKSSAERHNGTINQITEASFMPAEDVVSVQHVGMLRPFPSDHNRMEGMTGCPISRTVSVLAI